MVGEFAEDGARGFAVGADAVEAEFGRDGEDGLRAEGFFAVVMALAAGY